MSLLYKEDWDETKERYRAWWAGEYIGRCAIHVIAPRDDAPNDPPPPRPPTSEQRWADLDYIAALNDHTHRATFYGGEAFPTWQAGYPGSKSLPAFLGCEVELDFDTGWVDPILNGDSIDCDHLELDENNPRFQHALREQKFAVEAARGKSVPTICGAFGGCGDTLAWLRGSNRLLMDLIHQPDAVRRAELRLMDLWIQVYERFHAICREGAGEDYATWFSIWSPGKYYTTHNDFAYMISPAHFRELFLPCIEKQLEHLDHAIHHLDGIGNFCHAEALCELERLDGIQVVMGAGQPSPLTQLPLLKRVQAAGKKLHIQLEPEEIQSALEVLSARGLFIKTACATETQARRLLQDAEKWSHP